MVKIAEKDVDNKSISILELCDIIDWIVNSLNTEDMHQRKKYELLELLRNIRKRMS